MKIKLFILLCLNYIGFYFTRIQLEHINISNKVKIPIIDN